MKEIVPYHDSYGVVRYPEGFEECLEGLPIEKQLDFFRIGCGIYRDQTWNERRESVYDYSCALDDDGSVKSIVVRAGKIAGIMASDVHGKAAPCMAEKGFCITDNDEPDGSGYKCFRLYRYLICVSKDFDSGN